MSSENDDLNPPLVSVPREVTRLAATGPWFRGRVPAPMLTLLVLVGLGAIGYGTRGPVLTWVGACLVHVDPLAPSDAIVVLAGETPEREIEAADIYRAGYAAWIVLTQGRERLGLAELKRRGIHVETAIDMRVRYLRELGVPPGAMIVLDGIVLSTADESVLVTRWARARGARSLIVIASPFQTARARLVFSSALRGSGVVLRFRPSSLEPFRPADWWKDRESLKVGAWEWQKLIYYRLRYW